MNSLMIRLKEELLLHLTMDWVTFHYKWKEDFVYEYFTDYFYNHRECMASIHNSAHILVNIMNYVYQHEEKMSHDVVCIMNTSIDDSSLFNNGYLSYRAILFTNRLLIFTFCLFTFL